MKKGRREDFSGLAVSCLLITPGIHVYEILAAAMESSPWFTGYNAGTACARRLKTGK
jgi:hypothetical protein